VNARTFACILVLVVMSYSAPRSEARTGPSFAARSDATEQWWRCTGHLRAHDGRRFDFALMFFRYAYRSRERGSARDTGRWADGTTYAATLGIVDESRHVFSQADRLERGALGIASAADERLALRVTDWTLASTDGASFAVRAATDTTRLGLRLQGTTPAFAFSPSDVDRPLLHARGTLVVAGRAIAVSGDAWLDTTFGDHAHAAGALGWDRFWIVFDDGRAMLYSYERRRDGTRVRVRAARIDAAGHAFALQPSGYRLTPMALAGWRSLRTGARYPNIWGLNVPELGLQLSLEPVLYEQEIVARGGAPFWSGAVDVYDVRSGSMGLRLGRGYVELTGYERPLPQ